MRTTLRRVGLIWAVLGGAAWAVATETPSPPPAEVHQFDFWLGEWSVTTPDGKPAGTSRIESVAGGRALLENWTSAGGNQGRSLNAWNEAKRQWQQFWIGPDGGVLELAGGLEPGGMVLRGDHAVGGRRTLERITWQPQADGSVRQRWEQSTDAGGTWSTVFDGRYVRPAPKTASGGGGGGGAETEGHRRMYFLFW